MRRFHTSGKSWSFASVHFMVCMVCMIPWCIFPQTSREDAHYFSNMQPSNPLPPISKGVSCRFGQALCNRGANFFLSLPLVSLAISHVPRDGRIARCPSCFRLLEHVQDFGVWVGCLTMVCARILVGCVRISRVSAKALLVKIGSSYRSPDNLSVYMA